MTKSFCSPLTQLKVTKRLWTTSRFVTPDLYVRPALHDFQKVCLCRLAWFHSCGNWKELEGTFKSRHDYTFSVSPDLEVEAQSYSDGDGSLSFR